MEMGWTAPPAGIYRTYSFCVSIACSAARKILTMFALDLQLFMSLTNSGLISELRCWKKGQPHQKLQVL